MKGILIVNKFWTNFFSARKAAAVTIFPFIFILNGSFRQDRVLINHERIHIQQALEMGIIPFYIGYLLEFLIRYIRCREFRKAYLAISFEREAYGNQEDLGYLNTRKHWAFIHYLKKQKIK